MQVQTSTVEVVTKTEVRGIFLTEDEVRLISYPLFRLRNTMPEDDSIYSDDEMKAVRDLKEFIDNFQRGLDKPTDDR